MLRKAVACSSSGSIAILYVFPVLCMRSCFHIVVSHVYAEVARGQCNSQNYCINSNEILHEDKDHQLLIVHCVIGVKSSIHGCPMSLHSGLTSADCIQQVNLVSVQLLTQTTSGYAELSLLNHAQLTMTAKAT